MSCKIITIDLANVPPIPIRLGVAGENAFRTITFDATEWGADFPGATYTVIYKRPDGYLYPVLVNAAADAIVWSPTETDTATSGSGLLEVRLLDGETVGKTITMQTVVAPSLTGDESTPPQPAPDWVNDVAADADRAELAMTHYPKIVNGVWYVWSVQAEDFVSTGIEAQGEDGYSPTVTVTEIEGGHRVTITDAAGAHPFDVMDGEDSQGGGGAVESVNGQTGVVVLGASDVGALPESYTPPVSSVNGKTGAVTLGAADVHALPDSTVIPPTVTEQTVAGWGFTKNTGTYSKPSGGIPKTDLASAVQTSLGKADTALQSAPVTSVNNKTGAVTLSASDVGALPSSTSIPTKTSDLTNDSEFQTAAQVQSAIAAIPDELPTVTASDDGKVLAVDNGEWSADSPVIVSGTDAQVTNAVNDYLTQYGVPLRLSEEIKQALLDCFENVAWINDQGQTYYDALYAALYPPKTLVSISAVFNQGSAVIYDTDSLDTLKQYLTVTATYDDTSTGVVTTYTLSGTLTAGTSTITVTYNGKTDTFDVTVTEYDPLPSEYQRCEYIEATGTQYIITNIGVNSSTLKILAKYYKQNQASSEAALIAGQYGLDTSGFEIGFNDTANRLFAFSSSSAQIVDALVYGNENEIEVNFKPSSPYATMKLTNGSTELSGSKTTANNSNIANSKINLFHTGSGRNKCAARLFYCQVFKDTDTLVFDGIPCYRKSDNIAGLYDVVSGTFFTSEIGQFSKGGDV